MNLLVITPGKKPVPATDGGAVENLIQMLIDNNEKSQQYDITVISCYTEEAKEESKKYKKTKFIFINTNDKLYILSRIFRYIINRFPKIYIGNAFIKRVIKKLKNDFYNYESVIVENSPQYALLLKKKCKKLILHLHNDFLNKNTESAKKIINSYDSIYCVSNFISNRLKEIDDNYKNIEVLYNGIELEKFDKNFDELQIIKEKYEIKKENFVYLYTGRIVPEKGVLELIEAFILNNDSDSKLLIVGDVDRNTKYIKKIKRKIQGKRNIILIGKISYNEIYKYYRIANVGVIPSVWEEPFALTVIEHLASGNPVIISDSGAMPELVNNKCSIMVEKKSNFIYNLSIALKKMKEDYKKYKCIDIINQARQFDDTKYWEKFNELMKERI